jgi:hypothetical protein
VQLITKSSSTDLVQKRCLLLLAAAAAASWHRLAGKRVLAACTLPPQNCRVALNFQPTKIDLFQANLLPMSAIGLYEGAYFVGRSDCLKWLNDLTGLQCVQDIESFVSPPHVYIRYTKVEQCGNGSAYCMVMGTLYPDAINVKKVITDAKLGHDILKNFKMLQAVLEKKKIDKVVPVDSLMRMKYQDNLEFLQWIKCFHERQSGISCGVAAPTPDGQPSAAENRRLSKAPRAPLGATGAHLAPTGRPSLATGSENVPPKSPKGNSSARVPAKPQRPSSVGFSPGVQMPDERAVQSAKDGKRPPANRASLAPRAAESSYDTSERLKALEKTAQDMSVTVLCAHSLLSLMYLLYSHLKIPLQLSRKRARFLLQQVASDRDSVPESATGQC